MGGNGFGEPSSGLPGIPRRTGVQAPVIHPSVEGGGEALGVGLVVTYSLQPTWPC